jgi:methionine-rich copper-binding protein CopC/putative copper export protein
MRPRAAGRGVRLAGVAALLAVLVAPALPWAEGTVVRAHAQLVASSPGAGSVVAEWPGEIRLVFSEPLESQVTSVDVLADDGTAVVTGAGEIDPADDHALVAAIPSLPDGVYEVRWLTLSAADGHTTEGTFTFGVGDVQGSLPEADAGAMTHTELDPNRVVGRWLTYPGLLLGVGIPAFFAVVVRAPIPRPTLRLLAIALAASGLASLVMGIAAGIEAGDVVAYLTGTRNGGLQLARTVVIALGTAAVVALARRRPGTAGLVAAGAGTVGIGLLIVAGHASAQPGSASTLVGIVHVAGSAVWAGGLAGLLAIAVRPDLIGRADLTVRDALPRFSALALVSIGLVGITGIYSAYVQNGALLDTDSRYGLVLLIKTAVAVGALALGGLNFLDGGRLRGWLGGLTTRIRGELGLIGGVLAVSAALALTSPQTPTAVAIEPVPDAFGEVTPGMDLELAPARPGVNRVVVSTLGAMSGSVQLELVLDRLDTGESTRVPLQGEEMAGMDHSSMDMAPDDGRAQWMADALVLPANTAWDGNVVVLSTSGDELSRQRFAFTVDDSGVAEGRLEPPFDALLGLAAVLLAGGALGVGLGLGGVTLPRTERLASRVALVTGGAVALVLGATAGASRLVLG